MNVHVRRAVAGQDLAGLVLALRRRGGDPQQDRALLQRPGEGFRMGRGADLRQRSFGDSIFISNLTTIDKYTVPETPCPRNSFECRLLASLRLYSRTGMQAAFGAWAGIRFAH